MEGTQGIEFGRNQRIYAMIIIRIIRRVKNKQGEMKKRKGILLRRTHNAQWYMTNFECLTKKVRPPWRRQLEITVCRLRCVIDTDTKLNFPFLSFFLYTIHTHKYRTATLWVVPPQIFPFSYVVAHSPSFYYFSFLPPSSSFFATLNPCSIYTHHHKQNSFSLCS